ncbi:YidB family protein [Labrys monachus]|uniref:Uncharacterized protein YidB (DUF937 family) n=1 Tax=Labrys monachus TaxID=217067 RepID=A0ABU0FLG3_9HYPH|nr:YidB family protein [Labrys monachus]MDQ0395452.1 uncharacterized protein YidB (DUF937 family) [Labrys monachus]
MGFFDDALNKAAPGGNLAKPLIIAAGALLLAKYLHGNDGAPAPAPAPAPASPPVPQPSAADQGGGLLGGLGGLLERFQQAGHGNVIDSWIGNGQNAPIQPGTLGQVLGSQTISDLAQKAGINEQDLLNQLAQNLPNIIHNLTPNGRLPTPNEVGQ